MKKSDINIRDPFILVDNGKYYMYGTRAANFGCDVKGFDVYVSEDLENWSEPIEVLNSTLHGLNNEVNWAPEVHVYKGKYYMFASFTQDNGRRGTYCLKADTPLGPFEPHSNGPLTPEEWVCIDGSLYIEDDKPYLIFCHEHVQTIDGGMCYIELSDDLTHSIGEPTTMFYASEPEWVKEKIEGVHYITDGPFMFRTKNNTLLMLWSTAINNQYAECVVRFNNGTIKGSFEHLKPLIDDDGGHGMLFNDLNGSLILTFHTPNRTDYERPEFLNLKDCGNYLER